MKIYGIILLLSVFLAVDANRQCRKEMNTLFGKAEKKGDHHKKLKVICAKNKGFLDNCKGERCKKAQDLLAEVLPKFEELEDSVCLKRAANCKRRKADTKNDKAEVKE